MKGYILLTFFLIMAFLAVFDSYSQTPLTPRDVVIVLDNSGKMKVDDPELPLSKVISEILGSLPENSRVSFIVYAGNLETVMELTPVSDEGVAKKTEEALGKLEYTEPEAAITVTIKKGDTLWELADKYYGDPNKWPLILEQNGIPKGGQSLPVGTVIKIPNKDGNLSTRVSGQKLSGIPVAMEKAIYNLKLHGRKGADKQIILIADGFIDVKDSALAVERYRWLQNELVTDSKEAGIRIFSIALTDQADFEFMQTMAQKTNGGYYRVFSAADTKIALDGMNKAAPVVKTVSEPEPTKPVKTAQAKTSSAGKTASAGSDKGMSRGLLIGVLAAAGLIILVVAVFIFMKSGKKTKRSSSAATISGAYLMDLSGVTEKSNYAIDKEIIKVGRGKGEDVDICINKGTVSTVHAQIEYRDKNFYLTDLGSTNGTYVNDDLEKITGEVRIGAGDIISFDQYKFKLVARGQASRSSARSTGGRQSEAQSMSSSSMPEASSKTEDMESVGADSDISSLEAYLVDTSGITDKESHKIAKRITRIGRARGNAVDIFIDGNTISGLHAQIEYRDGKFYLTDLGSMNGTFLSTDRERVISEVCLENNDVIYFDQYKFKFVIHEQSENQEAQLSESPEVKVSG